MNRLLGGYYFWEDIENNLFWDNLPEKLFDTIVFDNGFSFSEGFSFEKDQKGKGGFLTTKKMSRCLKSKGSFIVTPSCEIDILILFSNLCLRIKTRQEIAHLMAIQTWSELKESLGGNTIGEEKDGYIIALPIETSGKIIGFPTPFPVVQEEAPTENRKRNMEKMFEEYNLQFEKALGTLFKNVERIAKDEDLEFTINNMYFSPQRNPLKPVFRATNPIKD